MSSKPKAPEREPVTLRLSPEGLKALDEEIALLIAGIPGAKLSRSAFIETELAVILADRKAARAPQAPAAAPALAPVKPARKAS